MLKLYTYILFITFSAVSAQTDVEVTNPFKNSQRSKRWLKQPGIGPPRDYNQFVTRISQAYDPSNYEHTQSKRDLGPFNFIPDYTTPVQNILKNIPGYSWIESNNPGGTYTQVIEGGQNPLRDIFNAVFGPEQTDRILQTGQPSPGQTQPQNFYNNNEYPNRDYENNFNRQQGNDIQIQPSITEVVAENSGNVYNTQYTPYNNNQQQSYSTSQAQFATNPQYTAPSQPQTSYSQSSAFSSSSQFDGYGTQQSQSNSQQSQTYSPQSQQPNTFNINNPGVQGPTPQTQYQFNSMQYENSFPMSNNPQLNNNVPSQNYRPSNANVQGNPQFQNPLNMQTNVQTASQQSSSSILNGQQSVNTPNQVKQKQNPQPEVKYKVLYQTTTPPNLLYTQPPTRPTSPPQKSTGQVNGIPTSQQASRPVPTTSFPAIQSVTDFNPPLTNIKVEQTTRRVSSVPTTRQSKTTTSPYMTRPKLITDNQVVGGQFPPTDNNDKQGVNFKKDALELYGTVIQNVSYAALPNRTAQTAAATDRNKITTPTVQVKTESRFGGYDANSFNQVPTTSKPVKKKCDAPPSPPVPDFREPGRRLSQIKCYEYIWEQQERVSKWNSKRECHRDQNESFYIAGREGMPAEYPHMAAIGWSGSNGAWIFKCAGALVSPRFVLTAAHCSRMPPSDNSVLHAVPQIVRLGDRDVAEKVRTGIISVDVGIKQIITHPEYSPPKQYSDIALIELDKDIKFTRHVQPSCLWSNPDTSKLGNQFIATGWGVVDTAFENKPPPPLHKVAVNGLDTNTCKGLIESYCNRNWCGVSENQICGNYRNGTLDACQGDSGAPLQRKIPLSSDSEGSMHYVIGVTSLRIDCGQTDLPAVYTRLSGYINWIENIVWLSNN